jgi:hypothetical protein
LRRIKLWHLSQGRQLRLPPFRLATSVLTLLPFHAACGDRGLAAKPDVPVVLFSEKLK